MRIVSIDPGKGGAIAIYNELGNISVFDMPKTPKYITDLLWIGKEGRTVAYIEQIQARENDKLHVASAMKLMKNYGGCLYTCFAYNMKVNITPSAVWMSGMIKPGLDYAKRKTELWKLAKAFFPDMKIKKFQADALCLLRYAMQKEGVEYEAAKEIGQ